MRSFWKKDTVISIKLTEDCYSLAQMVNDNAQMRFFSIFNQIDSWENIDLDTIEPLFSVFVGNVVIQKLGQRRVPPKEVNLNKSPCNQLFIEPISNAEGYRVRNEFWDKGGNLVDLGVGARIAGCDAPIVKSNLNPENNLQDIIKHELTNMWGDNNIKNRLLMKKERDINIDQYKFFIFPGLLEKMKLSESDFDWADFKRKPSDFFIG
ncbi:hypothetical protein M4R22_19970 [Acidovorax sp. GBBC 3334]|uniref:hypothetical protein n=1 Tax=Acidovorax sp. GBBC 3334 TaxID=2940496 RepID=UPI002302BB88|nr:hypothetical protein [Acidovorax sp. GBBC 3334]MDA8457042.1 hypothetical protein [Acidovorax sp. GBBC 3334]